MERAATPYLVDTTLREGEQRPEGGFDRATKLCLAQALARLGVREIEAGCAAAGEAMRETCRRLARLEMPARLTAWCRGRREDLEAARACDVDAVHLSFPASPVHRRVLEMKPRFVIESIRCLVALARERWSFVSVGAADAGRAEPEFLREMATAAADAGASRFRFADTVGVCQPARVARAVADLRQAVPALEIGFHGHNDLGLATANALAACEAGAACVDASVGGIGERSGGVAMEQILVAGQVFHGWFWDCHSALLAPLAAVVFTRQKDGAGRLPLIGRQAFTHTSGVHTHGVLRDPSAFEPLPPGRVGNNRRLAAGKTIGRAGARALLRAQDLDWSDAELGRLLDEWKTGLEEEGGSASLAALLALAGRRATRGPVIPPDQSGTASGSGR